MAKAGHRGLPGAAEDVANGEDGAIARSGAELRQESRRLPLNVSGVGADNK
jgi:hypothetical protein